ncbi:glycoside hydrolase family 127 protein [Rufibacter latericius]|uniref:Glycoside hydrolase family 127 protein n=1 Tax=Rufibacter latericius TaxID=2487040 RepID=A0A3M9N1L8_9BACT|nr:glycoside hydrolase family 127 protein [Rufibacter latericius]RNI31616.1 glycoside hydrolase family 127 protein [Rufibacter latericius]
MNKRKRWSILPLLLGGLFSIQTAQAQSYVPEWNNIKMQVKPVVGIKAYSFNLQDVKLLESPFKEAMKADANYLLKIEPDRLLSDFRTHAGMQPKAPKYGGWESSGLAGHSLGHYLSACAMQYASTKDKSYLDRVNYIVDELAETQKARKTGYVGAIPNEDKMWAEVASGNIESRGFDLNGAWAPWYTVHKIMAGLLDAYQYCGNEKALAVNKGIADWTGETIKGLSDEKMQEMMVCEYGGMAETLVNTYAITKDKKYLDLSYRFYDKSILDPLAQGKDILPGKHSNTQIPKIIASARRYELTGDKKDIAIADFFWKTVTQNHSYATGGNSNYEYLAEPGKLNDKLTDNTTETCNTYNMLKLTRHLFTLQPSAHLMDYYEKALYNHILASQNHADGMMTYFVPLRMGGRKFYSTPFDDFTCCVGSGMENHVKYGESIYFRGEDGSLFVNLFIPSELDWKEKGVKVKQETELPAKDHTTLTIATAKTTTFPLRIRRPHWGKNLQVKVNGEPQKVTPGKDGYLVLTRNWKNNDKIEFTAQSDFYTEAMPDNPNRKAVFYGPVLLAGVLGEKEPEPVTGVPVLVTSENNANKWIRTLNEEKLQFQTSGIAVPEQVNLIPFNQTGTEYYTVYWDVFTPEKWAVQKKVYEAEKQKQRDLEARTVDILRVGEMQPERDHELTGDSITNGEDHGRKWRATKQGGKLVFKMKVAPTAKNTLIATYWGMDNRDRNFDILVDGVKIASEDLNKYKASKFYDIGYDLPQELVKGKQQVTVTLQAKPKNSAGPVYGVRMVKENVATGRASAK